MDFGRLNRENANLKNTMLAHRIKKNQAWLHQTDSLQQRSISWCTRRDASLHVDNQQSLLYLFLRVYPRSARENEPLAIVPRIPRDWRIVLLQGLNNVNRRTSARLRTLINSLQGRKVGTITREEVLLPMEHRIDYAQKQHSIRSICDLVKCRYE